MKINIGRAGSTSAATVGVFAAALIAASLVAIGATPASADTAPGTITTIAGTGTIGHDGDQGAATSATLDAPNDVVVGDGGNIFVADWSAHVVRMIAGQGCTVGSTCPFGIPTISGHIYTLAGTGTAGSTGANGTAAASAELNQPAHLAMDPGYGLVISDLEANVVRFVASGGCSSSCPFGLSTTTAGDIYTVAGNGTAGSSGDGIAATSAKLNSPRGLAVTSNGVLYIADYGNNKIRKVAADGTITTLAGTGAVGPASATPVAATAATFNGPISLALNPGAAATLYIGDSNNHAIRSIDLSTNMVSTIAGTGSGGYTGDGGPATSAKLFYPDGLTSDTQGNLFIADFENNVVREIATQYATNGMTAGDIYTVAGNGTPGHSGDNGTATAAQLHGPSGVAVDSNGNLIIADTSNHLVRQVSEIESDTHFAFTDPVPAAPTYRQTVLGDGPSLYYRLDESVGSTHAENSAGSGDGTSSGTYGSTASLSAPGAIANDADTGASGTGGGPVLTASDAGLPAGDAARTIEAWFALPSMTSAEINACASGLGSSCNAVLVQYGGPAGNCGSIVEFSVVGNGTQINDNDDCDGLNWNVPANLHDGAWHHAALVIDGAGHQTAYLDGHSLGTQNITLGTAPLAAQTGLKIGAGFDTASLKGSIDEVAIYPTALTANQIAAQLAASGQTPNPPAGLTATADANTAALSWSASMVPGGAPVTDYYVTASQGGTAVDSRFVSTAACSAGTCSTTLGLPTSSSAYDIGVAGIDHFGPGQPASTTVSVTSGSASPGPRGYASTVTALQPSRYFRFTESGGHTAYDSMSVPGTSDPEGTYTAAATLGQPSPIASDSSDTAVSDDGSGPVLTASDAGLPAGDAARTIEAWFTLPVGTTDNAVLVQYGGGGCGTYVEFSVVGNGTQINDNDDCDGLNWNVPANLHDGAWHHAALVIDGAGHQTAYLDGHSLGTQNITLGTAPLAAQTGLKIGAGFDTASLKGSIDEVAIYPTALTANQIAAQLAASGQTPNPPAGLTATADANTAALSWSASMVPGGAPVTDYYVTASQGGTAVDSRFVSTAACSAGTCSTTLGLPTSSSAYDIGVAGIDHFGPGQPASTTVSVTSGSASPGPRGYASTVTALQPSRYFRFTESGGHTAYDSMSVPGTSDPEGTYTAAATLGQPSPIASDSSDTAVSDDGSGPVLTASDAGLPAGDAARTIEAWFTLPVGTTDNAVLVQYGGGGCGTYVEFSVVGNGTQINDNDDCDGLNWNVPANLHDGAWHHAALVIDGAGHQTAYLDGHSLGTQNITLGTAPLAAQTGLKIGAGFDTASLKGSIDEVAIYPTALTANQIAAHFAAASAVPVATTTTSVDSGTNPSLADQSVTFTATVTPVGATGAVAFSDDSDGAALACSGTVDPTTGQATCTVSNLSVGTHVITAAYSGDSAYAASSGSMSMPQVVQAPSKIHLTPSTTHPSYGEDVTVTATVASAREGMTATPTGHVQFFLDGSSDPTTCSGLTQVALDSGQASCMFTGLTAGAYTVDAKYVGDDANGTYAASKAAQLPVAIAKASSTTGLGVDHAASTLGDAVTFTATVTSAASPSGTVVFLDDSTALSCTGADDSSVSNGTATCTVAGLSMGAHQVTATYSGDDNHRSSTSSPAQSVTVNQAATTTDVGASPTTSMAGDAVTFTATVSTSYGTPSGTVTFREGTTDLGARSLAAGKATFITTALAVGAHHITASYGGDADHATSASSPPLTVTVNAASTGGGGGGSSGGSGGAAPPASPAPPAPPAGSTSSESGTSQNSTGTADATDGDTTVDASGAGAFTVAHYGDNPTPDPLPGASEFIDTKTADGSSFTRLSITICVTYPAPVLKWFDPTANNGAGAWVPVTGSTETSASTVCVTVTLSATSSPSLSQLTGTVFAVAPGPDFTATGPTRVLDTRSGTGVAKGQVGPKGTITLTVPNLPVGTTAVVLNLTATGLSGAQTSYVSACPAAQALASCTKTSAINALQGVDVANEITVPVASDGKITLYNNAGSIDLVGDLVGYETGGYSATGPTRILDTRSGNGAAKAPVGPKGTVTLTVPNLPAGTTAVVLNLTGTGLTGAKTSFVSACPAAQAPASCTKTSALNAIAGRDVANEITVPVASDGKITLYNNTGQIDLLADLVGYQTSGFTATGPTRVLDTRTGTGAAKSPVGPKGTITITLPSLPAGTTAVVLNLTGTGLTGSPASYVSACPAAQSLTACTKTSALNVTPGVDTPNEVTVPVASDGKITLYNNAGHIDLAADLVGFHVGA